MKELFFVYMILSIICMGLYAADKWSAIKNWRRISERTLIFWAICAPFGALLGMLLFRHKIRKWYFKSIVFLFILGHIFFVYNFIYK